MKMARAAGIPAPIVLSCGEHPGHNFPISILMTRMPGWELNNSRDSLYLSQEGQWISELGQCLRAMLTWKSPAEQIICSALGTFIRSHRVPKHGMGPFKGEEEMMDYLLAPASMHGFDSKEEYHRDMALASTLSRIPHRLVFTHGDFLAHNVLVDDDGRLSGLIDWECAGWYPEYWEYTTAMRFATNTWWWRVSLYLGGDKYLEELEADVALNRLTVDSYIGM